MTFLAQMFFTKFLSKKEKRHFFLLTFLLLNIKLYLKIGVKNLAHITGYSTLDWEYLEEKTGEFTFTEVRRVKVPGGWLVESTKYLYKEKKYSSNKSASAGGGFGVGLTFIPDPEHKWKKELVWSAGDDTLEKV